VIDDRVLPAAAHLTGTEAFDVLAPAVAAAGGRLLACRPVHVQYRPGSDLVVRFTASVARADGVETTETLLAATTVDGPPRATLPVEAELPDGSTLVVGVWRWPFDPVLPALEEAVTPSLLEQRLGSVIEGPLSVEVVAYRPTERAVARVEGAAGAGAYVKVVRPAIAAELVERHQRLLDAGLPVPRVLAADPTNGLIAMEELRGPTLRERIKSGRQPWPAAREFLDLRRRLASASLQSATAVRSRTSDAAAHAAMLATVLAPERERLERLSARFTELRSEADARPRVVIHGDLHEGQVIVDGDRISGLLDIDDVGPGDPLDDLATVLAHLRFRAGTTAGGDPRLDAYVDDLHRAFAAEVDVASLDTTTAAVLVGLATGPFRIQQAGWQSVVGAQLDAVERLLADSTAR
jgi:aminoglycoside phosphotransferase (APT) family kinase protein